MYVSDKVYNDIVRYTVGFLLITKDRDGADKFEPGGSGVLANIGEVKGIITAAHVFNHFKDRERAAVLIYSGPDRPFRHIEFSPAGVTATAEKGVDDSSGPDVAFLQLPLEAHEYLLADGAFYNFEHRFIHSVKADERPVGHILSGFLPPEAYIKEAGRDAGGSKFQLLVQGGGAIKNEREVADGFDIFEFIFSHNEEVRRPESYGGLSGSAVWRTDTEGERDSRLIYGLVFYETEQDEHGERSIRCHGPETIYRKLLGMVSTKFPNQYKKID